MFYVYLHRRVDNKTIFYIGKGKDRRAWRKTGRNAHWTNIANKTDFTIEILEQNLSEEDAFSVECELIDFFHNMGCPLVNKTGGGEGSSGFKHSTETKQLIRLTHLGKPKSPEAIEKTRQANLTRIRTPNEIARLRTLQLGRKQTAETRKKRSETLKRAGTCNDRNVYVFFSEEDVYIGTRRDFANYADLNPRAFRTLFIHKPARVSCGWSILNLQTMIIFKGLA